MIRKSNQTITGVTPEDYPPYMQILGANARDLGLKLSVFAPHHEAYGGRNGVDGQPYPVNGDGPVAALSAQGVYLQHPNEGSSGSIMAPEALNTLTSYSILLLASITSSSLAQSGIQTLVYNRRQDNSDFFLLGQTSANTGIMQFSAGQSVPITLSVGRHVFLMCVNDPGSGTRTARFYHNDLTVAPAEATRETSPQANTDWNFGAQSLSARWLGQWRGAWFFDGDVSRAPTNFATVQAAVASMKTEAVIV